MTIFEDDEQKLRTVSPDWTADELLSQKGIFYLKDIAKLLNLDLSETLRHAKNIQEEGGNPYSKMGLRKIWAHWIVRISVFAPYYRRHLTRRIKSVDPSWDGNKLLAQEGLFLLTDVVKHVPFNAHQLRYLARKEENPRTTLGVFKTEHSYLVDMPIFAEWVKKIWSG